jgi:hypothetical protein
LQCLNNAELPEHVAEQLGAVILQARNGAQAMLLQERFTSSLDLLKDVLSKQPRIDAQVAEQFAKLDLTLQALVSTKHLEYFRSICYLLNQMIVGQSGWQEADEAVCMKLRDYAQEQEQTFRALRIQQMEAEREHIAQVAQHEAEETALNNQAEQLALDEAEIAVVAQPPETVQALFEQLHLEQYSSAVQQICAQPTWRTDGNFCCS